MHIFQLATLYVLHQLRKCFSLQDNVVQRFNLVCENAHLITIAETSFFLGNLLGVLLIGPVADWYGRKIGYLTFLTLWMIFSIASHFAENIYVWITFRFVVGASSLAFLTASSIYRWVTMYVNMTHEKNNWHLFHMVV